MAVHGTADDLGTTLDPFNHTEQETLPVIDNPEDRRVTEVRALGRYAHELKLHRGTRQDDAGIFNPRRERTIPTRSQDKIGEAILHCCCTIQFPTAVSVKVGGLAERMNSLTSTRSHGLGSHTLRFTPMSATRGRYGV